MFGKWKSQMQAFQTIFESIVNKHLRTLAPPHPHNLMAVLLSICEVLLIIIIIWNSSTSILHKCESESNPKDYQLPKCNETVDLNHLSIHKVNINSWKKADDLDSFTVPQQKDLSRSKGLKVRGRKNELIVQLLEYA